jgi:hypothetical protein
MANELFDMANVSMKDTKLPYDIWIDSEGKNRNSMFDETKRNSTLGDIIGVYNKIILEKETDSSLRIEFESR